MLDQVRVGGDVTRRLSEDAVMFILLSSCLRLLANGFLVFKGYLFFFTLSFLGSGIYKV